ncbi:hypothetical protein NDU88_006765 [Pleurodeles waltl]|uniref:Uncharacterized protein n=1 Tax=Pleurodeles waltl TaxID=8319 RepID=A0AAV7LRD7_PLEWA|nr:hypothetical protein NDU88_006765 [Pleurodeles waltl]
MIAPHSSLVWSEAEIRMVGDCFEDGKLMSFEAIQALIDVNPGQFLSQNSYPTLSEIVNQDSAGSTKDTESRHNCHIICKFKGNIHIGVKQEQQIEEWEKEACVNRGGKMQELAQKT